ncbi:MAG TPA: RyR domain-containing protein [Anaerolineae bacterium]|nr:RyR domain-containing protein [Anaerolineae bacterium]HOQ98621.1 RyR domain-containing protein [Anaerolineae bacterium]HPL27160.1 RyR domain-containing protein [Anaerolineae bacterium]
MPYQPQPIDTSHIELGDDIRALAERLAENAHEQWSRQRLADGWRYGPHRDDARKETPNLVPYSELPEFEKEYDRILVAETLKAIIALGFRIERA